MSIVNKFVHIFSKVRRQGYSDVYLAVDIHETILKPSWSNDEPFNFYPYAVKALRELSISKDVKLILWSSCTQDKLLFYQDEFRKRGIEFDFLNENPDAHNNDYANFDSKFYFDLGFDDKFGFNPYTSWIFIYWIMKIRKLWHHY